MRSALNFRICSFSSVLLRIEIDAVEYSDKHVAIDYVLYDAHPNAVTVRAIMVWKYPGKVVSLVDKALGGIGCAGEHREVVTKAVR